MFGYTDDAFDTLERYISGERLAAYYRLSRGDQWVAFKLYEKNAGLSGALYGVIQGLEVTVRNSIHNVMSEQLACDKWYDRFQFAQSERAEMEKAKDSLLEKLQPTTPGRVVSELTFGFWVKLTGRIYEDTLWLPYLSRIFPIRVNRAVVHERFVLLKTLRNRIAHHERIIGRTRPLPMEYEQTIEAIRWINPIVADWVEHQNNFKELYAKKFPKKRPQPAPESIAAATPIPED
jgi:hypothetical protein